MKLQAGKAAIVAAAIWIGISPAARTQQPAATTPAAEIKPAAATNPQPAAPASPTQAAAPKSQRTILISLPDHKLALLQDGQVKAVYTVAVGKPSTPSPVGHFTVISHIANPTYSHDGRVVGPGPGNPVGTRWMGLSQKGYGIHGTNVPSSIGKSASHGCIRVGRKDLEQLFTMVQVGDAVDIRGERDAQVVAVFGPQPQAAPAAAAPAVLLAQASAPAAQNAIHGGE